MDDVRGKRALALSRKIWEMVEAEPEAGVRHVALDLVRLADDQSRTLHKHDSYMSLKRKVLRYLGAKYEN